jgi:integral membrane protein
VKIFRLVSLLEGISYLLILSVTLGMIGREYVFPLGVAHGVLFVAYLILSLNVSHTKSWSVIVWLLVFLASIVPLAFIVVELFLRKDMEGADNTEPSVNQTVANP